MRLSFVVAALAASLIWTAASKAQSIPAAVIADPPRDAAYPARMEVIHVPTGGVIINGVVYVASGPGPHPTVVFFHGLPGTEKNLDLAQAVRRAGWNAVTVNYRGSWGSGGSFAFAHTLEDAKAVLAFVRDPANAKTLGVDTGRIALVGHSMGGWVAAQTLADDPGVLGAAIISAGDFGAVGLQARANRAAVVTRMNEVRETLVGVTGDTMADELAAHADAWSFLTLAPRLAGRRLLVLYSEDFAKKYSLPLISAMESVPGSKTRSAYTPTDHSWSDARISLQAQIVDWLATLPAES
ncbi:alpha/beta hydrolase family protein [Caulobacter sp. LARHSG274]